MNPSATPGVATDPGATGSPLGFLGNHATVIVRTG
ncbi:MAG: hypothetical protein JWM74_2659 [Myxococcaceae bacterium]|nr:hypothetical protein [Myxococcaceae bacterium]